MDNIIHKPLKEITKPDELVELLYVLPEKHIEKILIIEKIKELNKKASGEEKKEIQQILQLIQPEKEKKIILSALEIPWGDWSRIYRVRGLFRAINFIEGLLHESNSNPNIIYNLAFLYYIAYSFVRDERGERNTKFRDRALELARKARDIYKNAQVGWLEHFMTLMGSLVVHEWRKDLPEYCTSLACNIVSLIRLLDHEYDEALISINESFESHPTPPEIYFSMGTYFLRKGVFNPAIRTLSESIKKKGEHSAEAYYQLGRAYYLKVQHFVRELKSDKGQSGNRKKRHIEELINRRIEKALAAFQASLSEDPYFSLPYYWMGLTYLVRRECSCEDAMKHIGFALQLDPKAISRYLNTYQISCRSENPVCKRKKIGAMIEELKKTVTT